MTRHMYKMTAGKMSMEKIVVDEMSMDEMTTHTIIRATWFKSSLLLKILK